MIWLLRFNQGLFNSLFRYYCLIMQWPLFRIVSGLLLLFLGRRLFWLFVGLLGFISGMTFAARFFFNQPERFLLLIAFGCGLIGVVLALFLQKLAIAIAGFLAGAFFATTLMEAVSWSVAPLIPALIGGVIGAILLSVLFDWALVFLSSATGAILIARSLPLEQPFSALAFVVLLILGIIFQARLLSPARTRSSRNPLQA